MTSRTEYSTQTPKKSTLFSGQYLRNHWTLDIGVLGYIGIVWPKKHSPEVRSFPPRAPCIQLREINVCNDRRLYGKLTRLYEVTEYFYHQYVYSAWIPLFPVGDIAVLPSVNIKNHIRPTSLLAVRPCNLYIKPFIPRKIIWRSVHYRAVAKRTDVLKTLSALTSVFLTLCEWKHNVVSK
jgi:hypothetical protein